jgi:lysophospholipase L1-like esterase
VTQPGPKTRNARRGPACAGRLRGLVAALAFSACSEPSSLPRDPAPPADQTLCAPAPDAEPDRHWVSSWRTAPGDALITHPVTGLTVRQSFAPHRDGARLRLRLSNRYSATPLTLESVTVARERSPGGAAMVPGTACMLRFGGAARVTLAAGASVVSDPVHYPVRAFERVGISFFAPTFTPQITRHLDAAEVLYLSRPGNHAADPDGAAFIRVPDGYAGNFLAIESLEVIAPRAVRVVVAVGDSITDGSGTTSAAFDADGNPMVATDQRYPNHLQRRIDAARLPLSVANAGIGGNELLSDAWLPQFGPSLLARLDHDVLAVPGASHVLAMIGTNDLGNPRLGPTPTADDLIAGLETLIRRVRAAGLRIILGTIPPAEGTLVESLPVVGGLPLGIGVLHGSVSARAGRDAVNAWIRTQSLSDGIVDFAACLEDPARPGYLAPAFNSGDQLHPSPAGYAAMADCVDLNLLTPSDP